MAIKVAKKHDSGFRYDELEQRVLFSADALPGLDSIVDDEQAPVEAVTCDAQMQREAAPEAAEQMAAEARRELVFINDNLADSEQLIAGLQQGDDHRIIDVVTLDSGRDGIDQVSETLAERQDLSAVHFITHGADGQINLGDSWLNSTYLQQNSAAIADWGSAMAEYGDMLFYGCNIAEGGEGQNLLDEMALLTGTDVAASEDVTGHNSLGGDWELEFTSGSIETEISAQSKLQEGWSHLLAPPVITSNGGSSTASVNVPENSSAVTTVTAADPDPGDTVAFSISGGADGALFKIKSSTGELSFVADPDSESPVDNNWDNVYEVEVQVSYGNGVTDTQSIQVTVTDVGEEPELITSGFSLSYATGSGAVLLDPNLTLSDPDNDLITEATVKVTANYVEGEDILSFTDQSGITGSFNSIQGILSLTGTASAADYQTALQSVTYENISGSPDISPRTFQFSADDDTGMAGNDTRVLTFDNAVPDITSDGGSATATVSAAENQTGVTTVTATDADGDTLSYGISGGADAALFSIDGNTGELTFNTAPDFETRIDNDADGAYEVEVTADDGNGGLNTQTISITVTDVNEAPTQITLSGDSVAENTDTGGGFPIGNLSTTDEDAGDSASYSIVGGADAGLFSIGGAGNNELILTDGILDFETNASYQVTVRVTDGGGNTHDETFTISVNDLNEAPSFASGAVTGSTEDSPYSYTITTSDPDAGALLTITAPTLPAWLTLTDNGDGTATLSGTPTNSEVGSHSVVLEVSDGSQTGVQSFTIMVANVNDTPAGMPAIAGTPAEDQLLNADTSGISDADGLGGFSYQWLRNGVAINGETGSSFTLGDADVGHHIGVQVSYTDGQGNLESLASSQVGPVAGVNVAQLINSDSSGDTADSNVAENPPVAVNSPEDISGQTTHIDEPGHPAENIQAIGPSKEATQTLVLQSGQGPEQTDEILYLTDENDNETPSERRQDESGYIYLDNDFYKEMASGKYLSFNYKATEKVTDLNDLHDVAEVDFDNDDLNQVVENGNYDLLREEIDEAFNSERQSLEVKERIITVTATTFTVGIVGYLMRAGSLVAGLMATMPFWRSFDPIVIFAKDKKDQEDKNSRNEPPDSAEQQSDTFFEG